VLHTPGYGPACVTYVFDQIAFVGDTLRVPSCGTARTDLPGGDAAALCRSIRRILTLPDETRLLTRHHGTGTAREHHYVSTVAEQKLRNAALQDLADEAVFAARRRESDQALAQPAMMVQALRANVDSGLLVPTQRTQCASSDRKALA
jgi:glyoxylase-like metal-dependent hydrolase (beta-lactamase superfamily II)